MKKLMTVDTWLPIFSGFYETIWDTDSMEEQEIENINEERKNKGLEAIGYDDIEWDYKGYRKSVAEAVTWDITQNLGKRNLIQNGKFQEVRSPREYNFINDSINVQFTLSAENIKNIRLYLTENKEAFSTYLLDTYTSRSGFFSSYSNDVDVWMGELPEAVLHPHKLGAILQFILLNEEGPDYEMELYEHATGNGAFLTAENYQALTK